MKGWRSKLIFMFIIYFSGFATAIYFLAPKPDGESGQNSKPRIFQTPIGNFDSQEFVNSFNSGMHKCISFGKEAAFRTGQFIKEKSKDSELLKSVSQESNS